MDTYTLCATPLEGGSAYPTGIGYAEIYNNIVRPKSTIFCSQFGTRVCP